MSLAETCEQEIVELHAVFEQYFLGASDSLARVEQVLAPDFAIVGPDGRESDRATTMEMLRRGHGHTTSLVITISDSRVLIDTPDLVLGSYVESHELADRSHHRLATVVFARESSAPNGLVWRRVHETWVTPSEPA